MGRAFTWRQWAQTSAPSLTRSPDICVAAAALLATQAQDFAALRWSSASIKDVLVPPDTPPTPLVAIRQLSSWLQRCADRGLIRHDVDAEATALALLRACKFAACSTTLRPLFDRSPIDADDDSFVAAVVDTFARALR